MIVTKNCNSIRQNSKVQAKVFQVATMWRNSVEWGDIITWQR